MVMYRPELNFSGSDKKLLRLLERLLIESGSSISNQSNLELGTIPLSDLEAGELADRLDELINSRRFLLASHFVEGISETGLKDELRETYLSARKANGRERVLSSKQWADFLARFGGERYRYWGSAVYKMPQHYFLKMERRLLGAAGLHPHVVDLIMRTVEIQSDEIEHIRDAKRELTHGAIRSAISLPLKNLRSPNAYLRDSRISASQVTAAITIVADLSVMFTTRDWTVAGTLSTMAGALTAMILSDKAPR